MKNKPHYVQLSLFDMQALKQKDETDLLGEQPSKQSDETLFEQLYESIKSRIEHSSDHSHLKQQTHDILRERYINGLSSTEIERFVKVSRERIRQICCQFVESFMQPDGENARYFPKAKALMQEASAFIAADPADVITKADGSALPHSLLDFVEMTVFEERELSDQCFITPKMQSNCLRTHNRELVKMLRQESVPISFNHLCTKLEEAMKKTGFPLNTNYIASLVKGNRWIYEEADKIALHYDALRLPTSKIKRIIYEHKKIKKEEILRIYNERESAAGRAGKQNQEELNVILVKRSDNRFECVGRTGYWIFDEDAHTSKPADIRQFIKDWVAKTDKPFSIKKMAEAYKQQENFEYSLHSIRCYVTPYCVASLDDTDLMCPIALTKQFPHIRWSNKRNVTHRCSAPPYHKEVLKHLVERLHLSPTRKLPMKELMNTAKELLPAGVHHNIIYKLISNAEGELFAKTEEDRVKYISLISPNLD